MLTDAALKHLKPKPSSYKVADRDGLYVTVSPVGTITFRYDYRLNGRRETLTLGRYGRYGRYGPDGLSLALAREKLIDARRSVAQGHSPAREKQRTKRRSAEAKSFGEYARRWLQDAPMADSTRAMRKSILTLSFLVRGFVKDKAEFQKLLFACVHNAWALRKAHIQCLTRPGADSYLVKRRLAITSAACMKLCK